MPDHKPLLRIVVEPIIAALLLAAAVRSVAHVYSVPSESMLPTLEPGDTILVTRFLREPQRGDVVVFHSPANADELLVKRVVAVPGDLIDSRVGRVRIGGYTLPEPYVRQPATSGAIDSRLIPSECYFVLGDNREDSIDSRSLGPIPRASIVGRARLVLWSSRHGGHSVRAAAAVEPRSEAASTASQRRLFKWIE